MITISPTFATTNKVTSVAGSGGGTNESNLLSKTKSSYPKVPITWVDICLFSSSSAALANPKSETLGVKSCSNKMLLDLKSLCITRGLESSCR